MILKRNKGLISVHLQISFIMDDVPLATLALEISCVTLVTPT